MITVLVNGIDVAATPSVVVADRRLFAPLRTVVVRVADRVQIIDRIQIIIARGTQRLSIRLASRKAMLNGKAIALTDAPYQSGEDVMIPLSDVIKALHERLQYDARHQNVAIWIPFQSFNPTFTPAPASHVEPQEIFTPRPVKTPTFVSTAPPYPRRTPIQVHLGETVPL